MSESDKAPLNPPGCGVGLYAGLLLFICLVGVAGIVMSTIGMLNSTPNEARNLVHGSEVSVWRLQPMRDAGLLRLTEVPAAWHDRSPGFDGTDSCGLGEQGVLQLQSEKGTAIAFSDVQEIDINADENGLLIVSVTGPEATIQCPFGSSEGGERFARQIQVEQAQPSD